MLGENFKIQKLGENSPELLKSDFFKKCNSRCSAWEISNLSLKMKLPQTLSTLDSLQPTGGNAFKLWNSPEKLGENLSFNSGAFQNSKSQLREDFKSQLREDFKSQLQSWNLSSGVSAPELNFKSQLRSWNLSSRVSTPELNFKSQLRSWNLKSQLQSLSSGVEFQNPLSFGAGVSAPELKFKSQLRS